MKDLPYYINAFAKLHRNRANGGAPHKPILLLSIIRLFQNGDLSSNQIAASPLLYHTFKSLWKSLVHPSAPFNPTFCYPFFHLKNEPFWHLVPRTSVHLPKEISSLAKLNEYVSFAIIDNELTDLLLQPTSNAILEKKLVDSYFSIEYATYTEISIPPLVEELKQKQNSLYLDKLVKQDDENTIMRGQIFKLLIPQIYDHTCAISRMRLNSIEKNISMVDACHIVPFSESHDDSIGNGIALCPNLHRAFDRGLISISDDYTVLINNNFAEDTLSAFSLSQFKDSKIKLPYDKSLYPDKEKLACHRSKWGML